MKYLLLSFALLFVNLISGQRQQLLDELSTATCNCIEERELEGDMEMIMGLCAVQIGMSRSDEVKSLLGVDLSDTDRFGEFGEILAVSLIEKCPAVMEMILSEMDPSQLEGEEDSETTWSDMEAAQVNSQPDFGGPGNKKFITTEIEDTNSSGVLRPKVSGTIREVKPGLSTMIVIRDSNGENTTLYLTSPVSDRERIKKGEQLTLEYRRKSLYNAAAGRKELVNVIIRIEK
jgi:hypothetical protein